jgi:hypothetical protein
LAGSASIRSVCNFDQTTRVEPAILRPEDRDEDPKTETKTQRAIVAATP